MTNLITPRSLRITRVTASLIVIIVIGLVLVRQHQAATQSPPAAVPHVAARLSRGDVPCVSGDPMCWNFTGKFPNGWIHLVPTRTDRVETQVTSNRSATYQLYTLALRLSGGRHQITATFRILQGGLAISILDVATQKFLVTRSYSAQAEGLSRVTVSFQVDLRQPTGVQIVLSNALAPRVSKWGLRQIALRPAP